jgi:hypothetical protein
MTVKAAGAKGGRAGTTAQKKKAGAKGGRATARKTSSRSTSTRKSGPGTMSVRTAGARGGRAAAKKSSSRSKR